MEAMGLLIEWIGIESGAHGRASKDRHKDFPNEPTRD